MPAAVGLSGGGQSRDVSDFGVEAMPWLIVPSPFSADRSGSSGRGIRVTRASGEPPSIGPEHCLIFRSLARPEYRPFGIPTGTAIIRR